MRKGVVWSCVQRGQAGISGPRRKKDCRGRMLATWGARADRSGEGAPCSSGGREGLFLSGKGGTLHPPLLLVRRQAQPPRDQLIGPALPARVAVRCRRRARRPEQRRTFPVRAAAEKTGAPRSRTGNAAPLPAGKRDQGMGQDSARGREGAHVSGSPQGRAGTCRRHRRKKGGSCPFRQTGRTGLS